MSHEDPKNTGTNEDEASETSRRRFLKGGAAAAVGAIAAAAIPSGAEAHCRGCPPPTDAEREALANALVKAWQDPEFRAKLLTFPDGKPPRWNTRGERSGALARTRLALAEFKVISPDNVHPVVLTHDQFEYGGFEPYDNERIYQMPDRPDPNLHPELKGTVGLAKYAIDFHICGM